MLVGREAELAALGELVDRARHGRSGVIVVRGEAGIGKSALLDEAVALAADMRVLRAHGSESETELAFAGLFQLLRPVVPLIDSLPEPQRVALASALAIGPRVASERLPIFAGVLGVLAAAARDRPVLAVIDDAHLLDRVSAAAIVFAARRLADEGVAIVIAVRDPEGQDLALEGLAELRVGGLSATAAEALVRSSQRHLDIAQLTAIVDLARGNPLALVELPPLVVADPEVAPAAPAPRLPPGTLLAAVFGQRLGHLPPDARHALIVAAITDGDRQTLSSALRFVGLSASALEPAAEARVGWFEGDLFTFRHPLVRNAAYSAATPSELREAHAAVAKALRDDRVEEQRVWHLALAALEPDEAIAGALDDLGARHLNASPSSSARAFERAASLSATPSDRAPRLLAAAKAWEQVGDADATTELAEEGLRLTIDPVARADLTMLLARIGAHARGPGDAAIAASTAAESIATLDPERSAQMLAEAADWLATDHLDRADHLDHAEALAKRAWTLEWPRGGATEQLVALRLADIRAWRGDFEGAEALWLRSAALARRSEPMSLRLAAEAEFSAGHDEQAIPTIQAAIIAAREQSAVQPLTLSLEYLALTEARRGNLRDALAAATEELELVTALGQRHEQGFAVDIVAWIEAMLGWDGACRAHVATARGLAGEATEGSRGSMALGVLELGLGRAAEAAHELEAYATRHAHRVATDPIAPRSYVPDLIEALIRAGRNESVGPWLEAFGEGAERSGRVAPRALALRCRGLMERSVEPLEEALELHQAWGNRFQQGRTKLCLGETLRRARRAASARDVLRGAIEDLEAAGAVSWSERAQDELSAAGARVGQRRRATDELTPQERNVARLVAAGMSNRDIAQQLFLSANTVESHLRHAFQKLRVSSRTQLALAFAQLD